jgi:hypothetical protein
MGGLDEEAAANILSTSCVYYNEILNMLMRDMDVR